MTKRKLQSYITNFYNSFGLQKAAYRLFLKILLQNLITPVKKNKQIIYRLFIPWYTVLVQLESYRIFSAPANEC